MTTARLSGWDFGCQGGAAVLRGCQCRTPAFRTKAPARDPAGSMPPPADPARCSGTERPTDPISAFPCLCGATCLKKRPGVAALPSEPGCAHGEAGSPDGRACCQTPAFWQRCLRDPSAKAAAPAPSVNHPPSSSPPSLSVDSASSVRNLFSRCLDGIPRGQCPRLQQCRRARGVNAPDCSQSNTAPAQRRPTDPACAFPFLCGSPS